jgi:hypothetical protein
MGLLKKAATYRWITSQSGGGGGLAILLAVLAAVTVIGWVIHAILVAIWNSIYGTIRPFLSIAPIITLPVVSLVLAWFITSMFKPFSLEETNAYLGNQDDNETLDPLMRGIVAAACVNAIFVFEYGLLSEKSAVAVLSYPFLLLMSLYGLWQFIHTPYRLARLLPQIQDGRRLAILSIAPAIWGGLSLVFNVASPIANLSILDIPMAVVLINITFLGGPLAVHSHKDAIYTDAQRRSDETTNTANSAPN